MSRRFTIRLSQCPWSSVHSSGWHSAPLQVVCCQGVKGYLSSQSTLGLLNGHSFQIGATTTASAAATPETTIKYLSRDGKAWHTRGTYAFQQMCLLELRHSSHHMPQPIAWNIISLPVPAIATSPGRTLSPPVATATYCFSNLHTLLFCIPIHSINFTSCHSVFTVFFHHLGVPFRGPGPSPRCDLIITNLHN